MHTLTSNLTSNKKVVNEDVRDGDIKYGLRRGLEEQSGCHKATLLSLAVVLSRLHIAQKLPSSILAVPDPRVGRIVDGCCPWTFGSCCAQCELSTYSVCIVYEMIRNVARTVGGGGLTTEAQRPRTIGSENGVSPTPAGMGFGEGIVPHSQKIFELFVWNNAMLCTFTHKYQ